MKKRITLVNMLSGLLVQICSVVSGIIVPKIILSNFGSDVNGLVSSIHQYLSYIALVEGGITGVVSAKLYKPLVDGDVDKLSSVLVTAKKYYQKIGGIFSIYTVVLAIAYPIIINTEFDFWYDFILTIILSFCLFIQYMFSLVFKTLLETDKRAYVVSLTQAVIIVCNIVLTYVSVKIYPNIHFLKFLTGIMFLLQPIVFHYYIKKHYIIDMKAVPDNTLIRDRWNGFAINIAAFIHNSTDISILTIFADLKTVSIYSVYALVTTGLKNLVGAATSGILPTVGRAYAKGDMKELNQKLDLYEYIIFLLVFFLFTMSSLLITPFVMLYTKDIFDADYYQPLFGILLSASEAIYLIKMPHQGLSYTANKFKEISVPAFLEAGINIVISLALVGRFGLVGVAIGTIAGMTYRMIFHVAFTKKIIPDRKNWTFYKKLCVFCIASFSGAVICNNISKIQMYSLGSWLVNALIYTAVLLSLYGIISFAFFKNEMKFFFKYLSRH